LSTPAVRYWAVVAAAGGGARMRAPQPKQYLALRGRTVLEHAVAPLLAAPWVEGVVVVLSPGDTGFAGTALAAAPRVHTARGGATRPESVLAGLRQAAALAGTDRVHVLVHDAARPCLLAADLERLREQASDEDGGLLALPVGDTVKRAEGERSAATVNRRELWRAQTPQLFRLDLLARALADCMDQGIEATDEAAAMEHAGRRPRLVQGREGNLKVTWPGDLALAEFWLSRQERQ
jgi:2-C-methyl-D-erythritol 4-phosphate cytidylyltransferase